MQEVQPPTTVYLDCHASTPCDPRVRDAMLPFFCASYANPSSAVHLAGQKARDSVESARAQVASAISADPSDIVFTGSATESNATVLMGFLPALANSSGRRTVLTTPIEHKSILENCRALHDRCGIRVVSIPVDNEGTVQLDKLRDLISEETLLVCVQLANNEIGTIQPVAEAVKIAHEKGALLLCDAAQALGRIRISVFDMGIDFLSLSAHKAYGPKGVGALYVRGSANQPDLAPMYFGGGQEYGIRAGTHNVPGIVGFGLAAHLANQELEADMARITSLRNRLESELAALVPSMKVNGRITCRLAGNSSLTFPGVDSLALMSNAPGLILTNGAACESGTPEPSYVLTSIGIAPEDAESTIRIGLGRFSTSEDISYTIEQLHRSHDLCSE